MLRGAGLLRTGRRFADVARKSKWCPTCCYLTTDRKLPNDDKFGWMDDALSNLEVRKQDSKRLLLDDSDWAKFAEDGFIEPTEEILQKLNRTAPSSDSECDISEQFVREFLEIESEDLRELVYTSDSESVEEKKLQDLSDTLINEFRNSAELESLHSSDHPRYTNVFSTSTTPSVHPPETHPIKRKDSRAVVNSDATQNILNEVHSRTRAQKRSEFAPSTRHSTKPGFEKRVLQQENKMSRIVEHVLATGFDEWSKFGASIDRVALSPNFHDLTVYYQVPKSVLNTKQWKSLLKQISAKLRTKISKQQSRYTPKVHFECVSNKKNESDLLNDLFDEIANERKSAN